MTDNIKTIREALDFLRLSSSSTIGKQARAALDALEAELVGLTEGQLVLHKCLAEAERDEAEYKSWLDSVASALHGWPPDSRKTYVPTQLAGKAARMAQELATLRARLAPADSAPGDENELSRALAIAESEPFIASLPCVQQQSFERVFAATRAHLRSQQPETEEQRALQWRDPESAPNQERVLFLVMPQPRNSTPVVCIGGWDAKKEVWLDEDTDGQNDRLEWYPSQVLGWLPLDALPPAPTKGGSDG